MRQAYTVARFLYVTFISLWFFFPLRCCGPTRAMASSFLRFLDHTQRRITVGRTSLDEWSARHRDHYLTTHNTHNRQTYMPTAGLEPTILASERPQTYALDRAATGTVLSDIPDFSFLITSFLCYINPTIKTANNHFELTVSTVTPQWTNEHKCCGWNLTVGAGSTPGFSLNRARKYSGFTGWHFCI